MAVHGPAVWVREPGGAWTRTDARSVMRTIEAIEATEARR